MKRRKAIIFGSVLVGVPLLLYALYALTLGRSPLAGVDHHDFGRVELVGGQVVLEYTFALENRTSSVIHITDVHSSCGCAVTELSTRDVAPGEQVEIAATLTLTRAGRKEVTVTLIMEGRGARVLELVAEAVTPGASQESPAG